MDRKLKCFISSSAEDLEHVHKIQEFLSQENIESLIWSDSVYPGMSVFEVLQDTLTKADFVIVIMPSTGRRENVIFELGYIMGMGKPLLTIIKDEPEFNIPTDLAGIMYLRYKSDQIESIFHYLKNWISKSLIS